MEKLRIYFTNIVKRFWDLLSKAMTSSHKNSSEDTSPKLDKSFYDKRYYKNINELPLDNWIKCTEGEYKYTRKNIERGSKDIDEKSWEIIYDDYIKQQGLGKMMTKLLECMIDKTQAELEYIITKDRFKLTECEMLETRLEQMLNNSGSGMTISQTLIYLSKWMGSWINTKSLTTKEYFDLLKEFEKNNKKLKDGQKDK